MNKGFQTLHNHKNYGFSLIELIIVIGILAILAALAIPAASGYLENAKAKTNVANAKTIYEAAEAYFAGNPAAVDGDIASLALVDTNNLISKLYLKKAPLTAKGNTYAVTSSNKTVTVTWRAETSLAAENPAGSATTIGNTLTYPAP